jgi:hypothetical protein
MTETAFNIADDEKRDTPAEASNEAGNASSERILALLAMIEDPDQSLVEINKRIAMEIAHVSSQIALSASDVGQVYKIRALDSQIKALRELSKTLVESESLAKRDVLNFDGPKFQFVLGELMKLMRKALAQSGTAESQINDVIRVYRDLVAVYDPVLRKETERITGKN